MRAESVSGKTQIFSDALSFAYLAHLPLLPLLLSIATDAVLLALLQCLAYDPGTAAIAYY